MKTSPASSRLRQAEPEKGLLTVLWLALTIVAGHAQTPRVSTLPASAVGLTNATLNGVANPQSNPSQPTTAWFVWGIPGNLTNLTAPQFLGGGHNDIPFSQLITGLAATSTYSYFAVASNSAGVVSSTNQSFTTIAAPAVFTLPATAAGSGAAALNGVAKPHGDNTTVWFELGATTNYGTTIGAQSVGSGNSDTNFSTVTGGYSPGTTLQFRAVASNSVGVVYGANQSYTILGAPTAATLAASAIGLTNATLNGTANPGGLTTTGWFEWADSSPGSPTNVTSSQLIGGEFNNTNFSQSVTGLTANSTYTFRAIASNSAGVAFGTNQSFTTPLPPSVSTLLATAVGSTNATLNGAANPQGSPTTVWFEWGVTTNYGNVTLQLAVASGSANTNFSQNIGSLLVGITYNFRAVASNSLAVVFGANQTFTTPVFQYVPVPGIIGLFDGAVAWGDYDNDGLLDFIISGDSNGSGFVLSQLWRNTGSGFTEISAGLPGVYHGSVAWGDYDSDGRLDIVFTGIAATGMVSQVWRNTGSGFTNINAGLPGAQASFAAWGDYDNDGRLDILLTGQSNAGKIAQLWRNTINGFAHVNLDLPGVVFGSPVWGDYDNDGRLDILLTGATTGGLFVSQVWRNTGSGFTNINAGLPGVDQGSVAWGDYDNDGWLDILLTGEATDGYFSQVWRNTGNGFTNINAGLPGVGAGSAAWGDYDNDGRLDILLTGLNGTNGITQVWRNTGSGFTNINAGLPGVYQGSVAWGDYDNDGRLDILLTGRDTNNVPISQLWRNNTPITNSPPTQPGSLAATVAGPMVTLSWAAASDLQTPAVALSYNVRIGTTPGGSDVLSAMSGTNGLRRLPGLGNGQLGLSSRFAYNVGTPYYWSVQAVDSAFAGSPFASEGSFKFLPVPVPTTATNIIPGDANGDGVLDQSEFAAVLANLNGNGIVSQSELDLVLSNYFSYSPWLYMTNVAGLGGPNVTFALSNSVAGAFSVEYSTNLTDWQLLGPATPRYLFTDTNAPGVPQRFYRLRWP